MLEVADREVLPDGQFEIAAALTDDCRAHECRRPDDGTVDEFADMIDHRKSVVRGLRETHVAARPQRDRVRTSHPRAVQIAHGLGHECRILRVIVADREHTARGGLGYAAHADLCVTLEDCMVFYDRSFAGGVAHGIEVGIFRPPADRFELLARELERHTYLHERLDPAQPRLDPLPRLNRNAFAAAEVHSRGVPSAWTFAVDELARRQPALQRTSRFVLDLLPRLVRNRRELSQEIVHRCTSSRRSPMPSEPSPPRSAEPDSPASASASDSRSSTGLSMNR